VELLAGAVIGDLFSFEAGMRDTDHTGAPQGGEFMIAIDPARCAPGGDRSARLAHAERLFERILVQEGTRLPSRRRFEARERTRRDGVSIPKSLLEKIDALVQ